MKKQQFFIIIIVCAVITIGVLTYKDAKGIDDANESKPLNLPGKIVFHSERDGKSTLGIYLLEEGKITRLDTGNWAHFYKDGSHVVYQGSVGSNSGYVLFNLKTGAKQLLPFPEEYVDWDYDISPDGKRIAFISSKVQYSKYKVPQANLFVGNIDGTGIKQLTDSWTEIYHPRWSPDGKKISFHTGIDLNDDSHKKIGGIYLINYDGTNLQKLTEHDGDASWSPDGTKIIYSYADRQSVSNIYLFDTNTKEVKQITNTNFWNIAPVFSPDGKQILFASHRHPDPLGKGAELYIINVDGTNEVQVTPPKKIIAYGRERYATDLNPDWVA